MDFPQTSSTLLRCIAADANSARWGEFVNTYEPVMRTFLASRFPLVPADDIIQETLLAIVRAMPSYVYSPKERGHFRNYLMGILRHKALRHLRKESREQEMRSAAGELASLYDGQCDDAAEETAFRDSVYELALAELLADAAVRPQTKQIFIRTAINGEKPEAVAAAFGVTRNSVDQTKNRMVCKLRKIAERLFPHE